MTDQTMRYMHPWHEMAQIAKSGQIGDIFFLQGDYIHDMWSHYAPEGQHHTPWRIDKQNPQNILLGGGSHPLDLILWTAESPVTEVHAYSNKLSIPVFPDDDCYIVILQFESGAIGKVYVTSGCSGHGMGRRHGRRLPRRLRHRRHPLEGQALPPRPRTPSRSKSPPPAPSSAATAGDARSSISSTCSTAKSTIPSPLRAAANIVSVCAAALESIRTRRPQSPHWF